VTAKDFVRNLFEKWEGGDSSAFFAALAEDATWTAIGHTPISGTYASKAEYYQNTYLPLQAIFAGATICKVKRIIAEEELVVVEWHGETPIKKGGAYSNDYCWVVVVREGQLAQVTGYFDTEAVDRLFEV
jgi:ketosteroid isomerase-like protein